jgi:hypothetical protein
MEFVSLRSIIYDLLNIIRAAKISNDEAISERQIEAWIHEYRGKLIKQDIDKGKYPNPDYIQEYVNIDGTPLHLVKEDRPTQDVIVSYVKIPKTLDFNFKSGITFVGDIEGHQIQLVPEARITWQQYKKYTSKEPLAYLRDSYLYIHNVGDLQYITIRGIFEIPTEIPNNDLDSKYPIPINWIPTLKEMILKQELGIESMAANDDTNDSNQSFKTDNNRK